MKSSNSAVQKAMAGCFTSVVILAVLAALVGAAIEVQWSKQIAKKASPRAAQLR